MARPGEDDGILTAEEVATLDLHGVDWTVLSAWVEDETTRDWMASLYERRFIDRLATADAVHRATLESLTRRRREGSTAHPFYWAGFVAVGDRR